MADSEIAITEGEAPPAAIAIRTRVFVEEQGVAPEIELDGRDSACVHAVATQGGEAVGCARLRPLSADRAKVERVAVLPSHRTGGWGGRLMGALEAEARRRGWPTLELHAQRAVIGFYERRGWHAVGDEFEEAGIPHRAMEKAVG